MSEHAPGSRPDAAPAQGQAAATFGPPTGAPGGIHCGAAQGQPQTGAAAAEQAGGPAQCAGGGMGASTAPAHQPGAMYGTTAGQPGGSAAGGANGAYGGMGSNPMASHAGMQHPGMPGVVPGGAPAQGQAFAPTTTHHPAGYHAGGMMPVAPYPAQMAGPAPGAGLVGAASHGMLHHGGPGTQPTYAHPGAAYAGMHPGVAPAPPMGAVHAGTGPMGIGMAPGQAPAAPAGRGQQPGMAEVLEELSNGGNGLASLGRMLNFEDSEFWKGALVGAAAVLLLTNETVQDTLFKAGAKAKNAVRSGADKLKDAADDIADKATP